LAISNLFNTFRTHEKEPIIIVSGLPRSGTSMMMKMLAEGGLPILTDEVRQPDDDNPNGYYELEVVRQLKEGDIQWLKHADGKAVKVVSTWLEYLPQVYSYKVIFMERELQEILASQKKMLDHRGEEPKADDKDLEQLFRKHLTAIKPWLVRQPNFDALYVNYNSLIDQPESICNRITEFLSIPLNEIKMLSVPSTKLYRNRIVVEK
jgi:sulfotransferase family protein